MIIKIKNLYYRYISNSDNAWKYLLKQISNQPETSIDIINKWKSSSKIIFTPEKYTEILQLSFIKNWHNLSEYLLDNVELTYPFTKIPEKNAVSKIHVLDGIMTDNLLLEDHAAWLALMACHHPFHLLKLKKNYDFEDYHFIARKFFFHTSFKSIYTNKTRRELILSRCHTNATQMLRKIFLEMDLGSPKKSSKTIKI